MFKIPICFPRVLGDQLRIKFGILRFLKWFSIKIMFLKLLKTESQFKANEGLSSSRSRDQSQKFIIDQIFKRGGVSSLNQRQQRKNIFFSIPQKRLFEIFFDFFPRKPSVFELMVKRLRVRDGFSRVSVEQRNVWSELKLRILKPIKIWWTGDKTMKLRQVHGFILNSGYKEGTQDHSLVYKMET